MEKRVHVEEETKTKTEIETEVTAKAKKEEIPFYRSQHIAYLLKLDKSKDLDEIGLYLTEHLKMGGAYWCLAALSTMGVDIPPEKQQQILDWIVECQNDDGGFGGNKGHDSHITSTHYALLVLLLFDGFKLANTEKLAKYMAERQ